MFQSSPIARMALIVAFAFCLVPVMAQSEAESVSSAETTASIKITHGPYLQLGTSDSATIVWHTDKPAVSKVFYGRDGNMDHEAIYSEYGLIPNDKLSHIVTLSDLEPGAEYQYKVSSRMFGGYVYQHIVQFGDTVESKVEKFKTFDTSTPAVHFVMFSDIHQRSERLDGMLSKLNWDKIDFILYNGDMINDFMNYDQPFDGFLDVSVKRFAGRIPFVFARGNHELRGRFSRRLGDFLPTKDGKAYYSFDVGPVHFVVLDSGEDKEDGHKEYNGLIDFGPYRARQARWLEKDLASKRARGAAFRIVISHIPPREGGCVTSKILQEIWTPVANKGGVDLWLSGHTHSVDWVDPEKSGDQYVLVLGGNGVPTIVDVYNDRLRLVVENEEGGVAREGEIVARKKQ